MKLKKTKGSYIEPMIRLKTILKLSAF